MKSTLFYFNDFTSYNTFLQSFMWCHCFSEWLLLFKFTEVFSRVYFISRFLFIVSVCFIFHLLYCFNGVQITFVELSVVLLPCFCYFLSKPSVNSMYTAPLKTNLLLSPQYLLLSLADTCLNWQMNNEIKKWIGRNIVSECLLLCMCSQVHYILYVS